MANFVQLKRGQLTHKPPSLRPKVPELGVYISRVFALSVFSYPSFTVGSFPENFIRIVRTRDSVRGRRSEYGVWRAYERDRRRLRASEGMPLRAGAESLGAEASVYERRVGSTSGSGCEWERVRVGAGASGSETKVPKVALHAPLDLLSFCPSSYMLFAENFNVFV